jgi:hypothetical protein
MNDAQFSAYNLSLYLQLKEVYTDLTDAEKAVSARARLFDILNVLKSSEITPGTFPPVSEIVE